MGEFEEIVRKLVYRFAGSRSSDDKLDYEQEAYLAILKEKKAIDLLEGNHKDKYVYIVGRNAILGLLKANPRIASLSDEAVMAEAEKDTEFLDVDGFLDGQTAVQKMDVLTDTQKEVINMRFGLGGHNPHTYEEIGKKLGFSRQYAEQTEKKALKRLRKEF